MTQVGPGTVLSKQTVLAGDVVIGNNVTTHGAVEIGAGSVVFDGAVLGRPPRAAGTITRRYSQADVPLRIGQACIVGANAVLYTGTRIGDRVLIGDLASLREGCTIGNDAVVGRGVLMMYETKVGDRSRIIDGAIVTGLAEIEEDVFIGPGANMINDNEIYLKRFGLVDTPWRGPLVRRFAVIGAGAVLAAGVEIGRGALVAPAAMVTRDVSPWTVVAGVPARKVRDVDAAARQTVLSRFGVEG